MHSKYEAVIGLEVHAQLLTKSKAFASEAYVYGDAPNSSLSPVTLGHPGTLPVPNSEHFRMAVKMGLACHANINKNTYFARKNYFYPDLPKGYQISQHDTPLCKGGYIIINNLDGKEKKVRLTRIHIEEDSGKSIHDLDPFYSLVDLNRAGVPLIEIVTEPDLQHPVEAYNYLTEIRKIVRYLEICDGNMEEGSLRCDANVSVKLKTEKKLGVKVEVKNLNSIRNVQRALEYEIERQINLLEENKLIEPDTRSFDAVSGNTSTMRSKEMAEDYRYFPEPDIPPVIIENEYIEILKAEMPELPYELRKKYIAKYGLSVYDADIITSDKAICSYFEKILTYTNNFKAAANWLNGPVRSFINENAIHLDSFSLKPNQIADLIKLIDEGKLNFSVAAQKIFPELIKYPSGNAYDMAEKMNLIQVSDSNFITDCIDQVLAKYPEKVAEYKNGKKGLIGLFMGEVIKLSKGKADPKVANILLREKLEK